MNHVEISKVKEAASRLSDVASLTPLTLNFNKTKEFDAKIYFKREDLQQVRSYKIRGAYNKITSLSEDELVNGVVCASAGNHAQGVAYACYKKKIKGVIFMPTPTPKQKIEQVKMFGGEFIEIILTGDTFDDAYNESIIFCEKNKMCFIPPFDDMKVIEGQATVGLELLEQSSEPIDYIFLPVGGGGLISGVSSVFKQLSPETKIIGVEPEGAPSMTKALEAGKPVRLEEINKFIDGASVQKVGALNFEICKDKIDQMTTVPEGKVCQSILDLYNKDAVVVEPAGALSVAVLDQFSEEIKGKNVVCIISGSNNDITRTEEIKELALLHAGLKHYFIIRFPQRAGALKEFITEVLGPEDDITHFEYSKKHNRNQGPAVIGIELKHADSLEGLKQRMIDRKFFGEYLNNKPDLFQYLV